MTAHPRLDETEGAAPHARAASRGDAVVMAAAERVEAALCAYDRRIPERGSELHAAIRAYTRASRALGTAAGRLLVNLNEMVGRAADTGPGATTVGPAGAPARDRRGALEAVMDQIVRWCLDEYYRDD